MNRIPFGISNLDRTIDGVPSGSVVLLAGEPGAGAREFFYTVAVMNGLANEAADLFELHYGDLDDDATLPEAVHYVSLTSGTEQIRREMGYTLDDELVDSGIEGIEFADLSHEYFALSPVPREWYGNHVPTITDLASQGERPDLFTALADHVTENAPESLICIDSITDLVNATGDTLDERDVFALVKGLKRASNRWGGMILLLVNVAAVDERTLGNLVDATDGTIRFQWERGGSERTRTMAIQRFRGVLSRLEADEIVQFETEIHDGGFDVSDVRKIR